MSLRFFLSCRGTSVEIAINLPQYFGEDSYNINLERSEVDFEDVSNGYLSEIVYYTTPGVEDLEAAVESISWT